jgi:hypothetical protein
MSDIIIIVQNFGIITTEREYVVAQTLKFCTIGIMTRWIASLYAKADWDEKGRRAKRR